MDAGSLREAIAEVCPVISVQIGVASDRATWTFVPADDATPGQQSAAHQVITNIADAPFRPSLGVVSFLARWTDDEYVEMLKKRHDNVLEHKIGFAKIWDVLMGMGAIRMNGIGARALKQKLVDDQVLTQERADEIFK